MFDFLYSKVWWMQLIVAIIITILMGLAMANCISHEPNKTKGKLAGLKELLGKQTEGHAGLSKEHAELQFTASEIRRVSDETGRAILDIGASIREDKLKTEMRYGAMTKDQKKLDDAITLGLQSIGALKDGFAAANLENMELSAQLTAMKVELEQKKEHLGDLEKSNAQLIRDYNELVDEYNRLLSEMNSNPHDQNPPPARP